jgi:hypothetical protein
MSGWWMLQVLVSCKYLHEKRIPEVYCGIDKNNKKDKLAKSFYSGYVLSITHKALRGNRVWWFLAGAGNALASVARASLF